MTSENKIITTMAEKLLNSEFGQCYMCDNSEKNITLNGKNNGCDGNCTHKREYTPEDLIHKIESELGYRKKVYISGKITGTTDYMERFAKAQMLLEEQGYEVINPAAINGFMPKSTSYEEYMKMCFCMLDIADAIYMLANWENSGGANREYLYAIATNIEIMFATEM